MLFKKDNNVLGFLYAVGLSDGDLSQFQCDLVEQGFLKGYFNSPETLTYNQYVSKIFVGLLTENNPSGVLIDALNSLSKEMSIGLCLGMEWFTNFGDPAALYVTDGVLNSTLIAETWINKYAGTYKTLYVFDPKNQDYLLNRDNAYKLFLSNLYHYCGVAELFIDNFFGDQFQGFRNCMFSLNQAVADDDRQLAFETINNRYHFCVDEHILIKNESEFNQMLVSNTAAYLSFIVEFLEMLRLIRQCTSSIIETSFEAMNINNNAKLLGESSVELFGRDNLNELISDLIDDQSGIIRDNVKSELKKFLEKDFSQSSETGGFNGVIKRQESFLSNSGDYRIEVPNGISDQEFSKILNHHNQSSEDLAVIHRLRFILKNRDLLLNDEQELFTEKITSILKSNNPNFFADIFELYFYFLLKKSGLSIQLLKSQKTGGNEVSTCDYKLGTNAAADCKCIIGHEGKLHHISQWCKKVADQVESTIGYSDIEFGGAIIGIRDKEFGFLKAFQEYKGTDLQNIEERAFLLQSLMEIYSEFRRHAGANQKQVKFVLIYYMPSFSISVENMRSLSEDSITSRNEMMAIFTTKYATDEEVQKIAELFKPVCNFLFKFNNKI